MDPLVRVERGLERARISDLFFFFEGADRRALEEAGVRCKHVFLAYDEFWYHPLEGVASSIDVSFVGALYPNRRDLLNELSRELGRDRFKCRFYAPILELRRPWRLGAFRSACLDGLLNFRHRHHLQHENINRINACSRIAINILHPQTQYSLNMRAFETCGSRCFQLIEDRPAVSACFRPGQDVETFSTAAEAADKVRFYAANHESRERIAHSGHQRARQMHTMRARVLEMMQVLRGEGLL
ncbi:MAG: glycosyltransferase [Limisphaerales bacterium]